MNLLENWVGTPGATALGWTLVHSLWQGAAVAFVLAIALRVMRSARARYAASCAALVLLVAGFAATFAHEMPEGPPHRAMRAGTGGPIRGLPRGHAEDEEAPPPDGMGYLPWLAPLWMAGVLGFQLRGVAAWMGARRLRETGVCAAPGVWRTRVEQLALNARISRGVTLLESCLADVPVVIGYLRPAILLPVGLLAGLPASQVEAILLHELAHIRRHDYLVNLVQMFVEGLLFYHPAVWWISAAIRAERENCCDDVVVATQGDAYGYASALAALEDRRAVAGDAVLASNGGSLVKRIRRLLAQPEGPRAGLTPVFSAVILTVTLVGAMAAWQTRPAAGAAPQAAPAAAVEVAQTPPPPPAGAPAPEAGAESGPDRRPAKDFKYAPLSPEAFNRFNMPPRPPNQGVTYVAQAQAPQTGIVGLQAAAALSVPYRKWLNEDVAYIITDGERAKYKSLQTDAEREQFIEHFWTVRDPTPDTAENEFKEEHYRRIAYANEHFASAIPGWKTDRGRIYITYGPPDEIDAHPSGGAYQKPPEEAQLISHRTDGASLTTTVPFEQWRYKYIQDVGNNIIIEFVDPGGKGEYRMTSDPTEKYVAAATGAAKAGTSVQIVGSNGVQISVPLDRYGDHQVNVYARIATADGRVMKAFENTFQGQMTFAQFLALAPGSYRLSVAVKDLSTGAMAGDDLVFDVK
jgi:GWxTD domain-containing protein